MQMAVEMGGLFKPWLAAADVGGGVLGGAEPSERLNAEAGAATRGASSLISSRRGALALSISAVPKHASARPISPLLRCEAFALGLVWKRRCARGRLAELARLLESVGAPYER